MAVAFDAVSNSGLASGGNLSWTHTPSGIPRGVLVLIQQDFANADQVTAVTYGGEALVEVALSPHLGPGDFTNAQYAYFLGSGIPAGAQTVAVTASGNDRRAVAISLTASGDLVVHTTAVFNTDATTTTPNVDLITTLDAFIAGLVYTGSFDPANVTPDAAFTELLEWDPGATVASWVRRTTNPGAGTVNVGWTTENADASIFAIAVAELVSAALWLPRQQVVRAQQRWSAVASGMTPSDFPE